MIISLFKYKFNLFKEHENKQINQYFRNTTTLLSIFKKDKDDGIFDRIIGYKDIKDLLNMALISEYPISIILAGKPGNGKSTFLKCIENRYKKYSQYLDCTSLTKAGLRDLLFQRSRSLKILLLDEISRLKKTDQDILLNLIQDGRIIDTRRESHNEMIFQSLKIFATCNELEKLISPLKDRFDIFNLPEYNYEEFYCVCNNILPIKDQRLKNDIINLVWNEYKSKSVREVINISKYVMNIEDLSKYKQIRKKYSK